jgi:hypothetical protein
MTELGRGALRAFDKAIIRIFAEPISFDQVDRECARSRDQMLFLSDISKLPEPASGC